MALLIERSYPSGTLTLYAREEIGSGEVREKKIGEYRTLRGLVRAIASHYQVELDRKIR